jgi:hypothetical protein
LGGFFFLYPAVPDSWKGGRTDELPDAMERKRKRYSKLNEYDEDYDAGRVKKVKAKKDVFASGTGGSNPFQQASESLQKVCS